MVLATAQYICIILEVQDYAINYSVLARIMLAITEYALVPCYALFSMH